MARTSGLKKEALMAEDAGPVTFRALEGAAGKEAEAKAKENLPGGAEINAALKEGDYRRAAILLKAALNAAPESAELEFLLARALNKIAQDEYGQGNFSKAKSLLDEAIGLSDEKAFFENRGYVLLKLNDTKGAIEDLERAGQEPGVKKTLKGLYVELGNKSYKNGDVDAAADFYEKGLSADPGDDNIRAVLKRLKAEGAAEARMDRTTASHFSIKFSGGENAAAGHLLGMLLEEAYIKVGADFGFYPEDRIEALLYSKEDFRSFSAHSQWAGAIYDGRIKIPAGGVTGRTGELEKIVFHEYTHAVVHRLSGGHAPAWLNEGLAQYEEGGRAEHDTAALLKGAGNGNILRTLEGSFMGMDRDDAGMAYLISLSATSYVIREFGISSARRVLEGLAGGKTLDSAIRSALFISYDDLAQSWLNSLRAKAR